MIERKQSFLERLTGMQNLPEDEQREEHNEREAGGHAHERSTTEWSGAVYKDQTYHTPSDEPKETDYSNSHEEEEEDEDGSAGLAIDMFESDNELIIQGMIAGITPEHLRISITRDKVTLSGRRLLPQGVPDEQYFLRELYWGEFSREIDLPFEIDTDGAEAIEKYGLLIIRLPKLDTAKRQELKVKSV